MIPLTPKEQKVLNFIQHYSEKNGYPPTYSEIQEKFEYKAVSSAQQFIEQLTAKGYLKGAGGENKKRALEVIQGGKSEKSDLVQIPLEGSVAAGVLKESFQSRDYVDVPRYLLKSPNDYFALRVKGDSMIEDHICDGDYVLMEQVKEASNGQIVVAVVKGQATTLKRFYKEANGMARLQPANASMEPIIVHQEELAIRGRLLAVMRKYR